MKRRDASLSFALCLSLAAHGATAWWLLRSYTNELASGIPQRVTPPETPDPPVFIPHDNPFGGGESAGFSMHSSDGPRDMIAPEAEQDQAWLSRDPPGLGHGGEHPLPGSADAPSALISPPVKLGVGEELAAVSVLAPPARASGGPAADPAPQSDSESDPFSRLGAVSFSPGKVEARFGRKVKTVRPRLTLAGQYDLVALQFPSVLLAVDVDSSGKVTRVEVVKSSGSNEIDQPCRVALYDWWIEPPRDKEGRPVASQAQWLIRWKNG